MPEFIRSGCPSFSGVHAKLSSRHGSVIVIIGRTAVHLRKRLFWRKCRLFRWQLPSQNRLQNDSWVDRTCTALTLFPGQALGGLVLETPMFIDVRINLGIVAISVATPVAFNVAIDNVRRESVSSRVVLAHLGIISVLLVSASPDLIWQQHRVLSRHRSA